MYQDLLQMELRMNVVSFLHCPVPTEPLGWFKSPITKPEDLKGIKYRTVGLSADVFKELGTAVVIVAGGEIVPSLERNVLDAAEFANPSSDLQLGFPDVRKVYMTQSFHQPVAHMELVLNKTKFESLPADLKAIVRNAVMAESQEFQLRMLERNARDLKTIRQRGVRVIPTPTTVLRAQLEAWDRVVERESKASALFARIVESQRAWARDIVPLRQLIQVDNGVALEHYWKGR